MNKLFIALLAIASFSAIVSSCEQQGCGETKISKNNESESHNNGIACMNCHSKNGEGEGCFLAAGSVYESNKQSAYANGKVYLYSAANGGGTLEATLDIDAKGNFYTTKSIDFGNGLFPVVEGTDGTKMYMSSAATTGNCNSCHNQNTDKIYIN